MGYRPQTGSRRSAGQKFQKSKHDKAKAQAQKHQPSGKYLQEEKSVATCEEVVNKTLSGLRNLGNQNFALSPYRQYFDDWLVNLRQVISVFEANPAVSVDEEFAAERARILMNVEHELAEKRLREAALEGNAKNLSDSNHLLVQIDTEYAVQTREFGAKRNAEVQRLTRNVHDVEAELEHTGQMKTSFFGGFTKKAKAQKLAEITQKMNSAKKELELALQNFTVEQEKLHDEYERRKQAVIEQVQALEKEMENLEVDASIEPRRVACEALANAVNAFLQRKPASTS